MATPLNSDMAHRKPVQTESPNEYSGRSRDQVREDGVMKELYRKEEETRRNWDENWGFMRNPKRLWSEEAERRGLRADLFSSTKMRRVPSTSTWLESKMENIKLRKSGKFPDKSSGMIGWRSSSRENDINRIVGPVNAHVKIPLDPPVSGREPDPDNQKFIFLG